MARKNFDKHREQQISASSGAGNVALSNGNGSGGERMGDGGLASDEIAVRAYEIYEQEGRSDGRDMDHWLRAESELRSEHDRRTSSPNAPSHHELPRSARQHQPATAL